MTRWLRSARAMAAALVTACLASHGTCNGLAAMRRGDESPSGAPYRTCSIEGWTVLVNPKFLQSQPELAERTLGLLRSQLQQVVRAVPPAAVEKLRAIRFWVEEDEPHHPCMTYHPDPGWLREHSMNPEKARCVEIANARNFLKWTNEQKWMVLHELAHGYHHQFVAGGFQNEAVKAAYDGAMSRKLYDSVAGVNARRQKGYAASNHKEYFAELSEAYFGANDFYPFDREDLRRHDPEGYRVVERLWGAAPARNESP